jgi:hypothetical protein
MFGPVIDSVIWFWAVLIATSAVFVGLVHKFIPHEVRLHHRMLMQPALTVAGMMFSVLLGFFIAQSMKDYSLAQNHLIDEANSLGEVFRDARGLPEVDRLRIRKLCRQYADAVITDEWDTIKVGAPSAKAQSIMNDLWQASLSVQPTDDRERVVYGSYFTAMNALGGHRRVRTSNLPVGLPFYFWGIISIGASAIVTLTFLFAPDSKRFHAALLTCLLVPMTLNILLLAEYSYPFGGLIQVKPTMFMDLQRGIFTMDDLPPKYLPKSLKSAPQSAAASTK